MEFIRRLIKPGKRAETPGGAEARGAAPVQTQEEQQATRLRMESEMAEQRERRESQNPSQ